MQHYPVNCAGDQRNARVTALKNAQVLQQSITRSTVRLYSNNVLTSCSCQPQKQVSQCNRAQQGCARLVRLSAATAEGAAPSAAPIKVKELDLPLGMMGVKQQFSDGSVQINVKVPADRVQRVWHQALEFQESAHSKKQLKKAHGVGFDTVKQELSPGEKAAGAAWYLVSKFVNAAEKSIFSKELEPGAWSIPQLPAYLTQLAGIVNKFNNNEGFEYNFDYKLQPKVNWKNKDKGYTKIKLVIPRIPSVQDLSSTAIRQLIATEVAPQYVYKKTAADYLMKSGDRFKYTVQVDVLNSRDSGHDVALKLLDMNQPQWRAAVQQQDYQLSDNMDKPEYIRDVFQNLTGRKVGYIYDQFIELPKEELQAYADMEAVSLDGLPPGAEENGKWPVRLRYTLYEIQAYSPDMGTAFATLKRATLCKNEEEVYKWSYQKGEELYNQMMKQEIRKAMRDPLLDAMEPVVPADQQFVEMVARDFLQDMTALADGQSIPGSRNDGKVVTAASALKRDGLDGEKAQQFAKLYVEEPETARQFNERHAFLQKAELQFSVLEDMALMSVVEAEGLRDIVNPETSTEAKRVYNELLSDAKKVVNAEKCSKFVEHGCGTGRCGLGYGVRVWEHVAWEAYWQISGRQLLLFTAWDWLDRNCENKISAELEAQGLGGTPDAATAGAEVSGAETVVEVGGESETIIDVEVTKSDE